MGLNGRRHFLHVPQSLGQQLEQSAFADPTLETGALVESQNASEKLQPPLIFEKPPNSPAADERA